MKTAELCVKPGQVIYDVHEGKVYGGTVTQIIFFEETCSDYYIVATGARLYRKADYGVKFFPDMESAKKKEIKIDKN